MTGGGAGKGALDPGEHGNSLFRLLSMSCVIEHGICIDGRQHRQLSNWGSGQEYVEVATTAADVPGLAIVGLG